MDTSGVAASKPPDVTASGAPEGNLGGRTWVLRHIIGELGRRSSHTETDGVMVGRSTPTVVVRETSIRSQEVPLRKTANYFPLLDVSADTSMAHSRTEAVATPRWC